MIAESIPALSYAPISSALSEDNSLPFGCS
jgi:hypothetical protein